jgi:hypothetical protein
MNGEPWHEKHCREIEATAEAHEGDAKYEMETEGNPRDAQVYATLAVSARLEALSYAIRYGGGEP